MLLTEEKKKLTFFVLTIFSIVTIVSLSSTPENLFNNNLIKNNLYENILFFKSILPIIIFIILIVATFKEFKNSLLTKNNFIFILFSFLILFQIIGTLSSSQNYIKNLYYLIPKINIMFISLIFFKIYNKKFLKFYLYTNLIIFFLIFLYFFFIYVKYYLLFNDNFYYIWGSIKNNEYVPRPTGMARLAIIFSLFFFCIYVLAKKKNFFFLIFFNYLIFAFESRIVILSLLFISLIFILIKERYSILKTLKYLILIFIIPFIINVFIDFSKRKILFNTSPTLTEGSKNFYGFLNSNTDLKNFSRFLNSEINSENFSSSRTQDWQNILKDYDKHKVFGYGIHGDRILINQTASNGFLYSLVSGGYLATITYCVICIYSLYLVNLALLKKKFNKYSWYASSMIIFFLIRSLVENSFTIISFDFIIFFLSIFYLEKIFFINLDLKYEYK
jgi:hypothetical protein